jgi:hypothetical protein
MLIIQNPRVQCHMVEGSRAPRARWIALAPYQYGTAGFPTVPVCYLYHRLHSGVWVDRGPSPLKSILASYEPAIWTWPASLDFSCQHGLYSPMSRFRFRFNKKSNLTIAYFRGVSPPDCLHKRRACSPKLGRKRERGGCSAMGLLLLFSVFFSYDGVAKCKLVRWSFLMTPFGSSCYSGILIYF